MVPAGMKKDGLSVIFENLNVSFNLNFIIILNFVLLNTCNADYRPKYNFKTKPTKRGRRVKIWLVK